MSGVAGSGSGGRAAGSGDAVARARDLLGGARRVLVLTGAGISAESGVPTFRGDAGLWKRHRPEDLATPGAFERDPRLVWEWYGWRRELVAACEPNAAHVALAGWQRSHPGVSIATQNVDGLHGLAAAGGEDDAGVGAGDRVARGEARPGSEGGDEPRILEIHGTLFRVRCTACRRRAAHRAPVDASDAAALPRCDACGALARPDVVWFGEALERDVIERAFAWAEAADVCLVVGTSGIVQPAASLATVARDTGGEIVEVNPEETPLTGAAAVSIRGTAGAVVPRIVPGPDRG